MPTYDYRCTGCGHEFEHFQSMSSSKLRKCPQCGKAKLERLIGGGSGVIFKGGGFYETDYKAKKTPRKRAGSDKGDSSTPGSQGESKPKTKTDSDGASKGESKSPAKKPADKSPKGGGSSSSGKSGD